MHFAYLIIVVFEVSKLYENIADILYNILKYSVEYRRTHLPRVMNTLYI